MLRIVSQHPIHHNSRTENIRSIMHSFVSKFEPHLDTFVDVNDIDAMDFMRFEAIVLTREEYKELLRRKQITL